MTASFSAVMIYFSENLCFTILLLELVKIVHSSLLSSVTKLLNVGVAEEETLPFDQLLHHQGTKFSFSKDSSYKNKQWLDAW